MKIYLVTPKNPPSFWTYDRILPTLGKQCIFPNLSMPTVGGLTSLALWRYVETGLVPEGAVIASSVRLP